MKKLNVVLKQLEKGKKGSRETSLKATLSVSTKLKFMVLLLISLT